MRLTAELVQQAEQRTNPLGDRELLLRGYGIPMLENLSVTRDMYDCIDLSDNRITTLSNFPRLLRCHTLLLGDNLIDHVDATNVSRNAPSLKALVLTNNKIQGLHEIENLGKACPNLDFLILTGNPVCRKLNPCPASLQWLDYETDALFPALLQKILPQIVHFYVNEFSHFKIKCLLLFRNK